jgi:hypothetical protein
MIYCYMKEVPSIVKALYSMCIYYTYLLFIYTHDYNHKHCMFNSFLFYLEMMDVKKVMTILCKVYKECIEMSTVKLPFNIVE